MWTAEERYPDPDSDLLREAERWLERFRPERLRSLVESLPGPRGRLHAPEAMAEADALIARAWRSAGWRVGRQRIRLPVVRGIHAARAAASDCRRRGGVYRGLEGANLVAIAQGASREALVLVAHHDTVPGSPGAADNGAAVAMLLELASAIGDRRFRRTVIVAAPDFEEIGLLGSRPLVRWLRREYDVKAALVFDPIGFMDRRPGTQAVPPAIDRLYPGQGARVHRRDDRGDLVVGIYRRRSAELVRRWSRCLAATVGRDRVIQLRDPLDLPVLGSALALHPVARNFSRSDHVNFWLAGLPAIHVTDTANFRNPHYHRPSDTPDTLDYETLAGISAAAALLVEELAR